jgi:hypothetical protein
MGSIFDDPMGFTNKANYDNFFGLGGEAFPNGARKSKKSGYCEHCNRSHSVDFVHDIVAPIAGVAVLGLTIGALGSMFGAFAGSD